MRSKSIKERVLVTGAGGFVGRHVVMAAISEGFSVRATDLPGPDLSWAEELGAEVIRADLTQINQIKSIVKDVDYIAHIAAVYNLGMPRNQICHINVNGSKNLAEIAARSGVRHFVNCSTADTYGNHKKIPITESFRQKPENDYAYSKLEAEKIVSLIGERDGLAVTTLRPTMIYGPGSIYTASLFCTIPFIVNKYLPYMPRLSGGPKLNTVHVQDMAAATIYAINHPEMAGDFYNVADDCWQTVGTFINNLITPLGIPQTSFSIPIQRFFVKWGAEALMLTPQTGLSMITHFLQKEWSDHIQKHQLIPALNPQFDKGFLTYGSGDHVFDNTKLKAAGFSFKWPDFSIGWQDTVMWYKDNHWIP